jgi:hypothetical protein
MKLRVGAVTNFLPESSVALYEGNPVSVKKVTKLCHMFVLIVDLSTESRESVD